MAYDFRLSPEFIKQESTINSILEGRLVPRDLSEFDEIGEDITSKAYVYIDNDGTPTKISLKDVLGGAISVEKTEPIKAEEGKIILLEIGDNLYRLEQFVEGEWIKLDILSSAENTTFEPVGELTSHDVQHALENLDARLSNITDGSVRSLNELTGEVSLFEGDNIDINQRDNGLVINVVGVTTDEEAQELEQRVNAYTDNAEAQAKAHADSLDDITNEKFDAQVLRLDNKADSINARVTSEVNTLNSRIDNEVQTLNNTIDTKEDALYDSIDELSNDVYHKNVIKPIALTGQAVNVAFEPVGDLISTNVQDVVVEVRQLISSGGLNVKIKKEEVPEGDNLATYSLLVNDVVVASSDVVNIPKDYVIKSGSLESEDSSEGPLFYLDLVVNTEDNSVEDRHIFISLADINKELDKKANNIIAGEGISIYQDSEGNNIIENIKPSVWGGIEGNLDDQIDLKNRLNELQSRIIAEQNSRISSDNDLANRITVEEQARFDKDEELAGAIEDEQQERIIGEESLQSAIENEVSARENADVALGVRLDDIGDALANEASAREQADENIRNDLNSEITRANNAEDSIRNDLSDEVLRAKAEENKLLIYIDSEGNRAILVEEALRDDLNAEIGAREQADSDLQTAVNNVADDLAEEIVRAKTAEELLESELDSEGNRARDAEQTIANDLVDEISRATQAELDNANAISDEETRAKGVESGLDTRLTALDKVGGKLDLNVVTNIEAFTQYPDRIVVTHDTTDILTGASDYITRNLPLADNLNAGLMSPTDVSAISTLQNKVSALEGKSTRLWYQTEEDLIIDSEGNKIFYVEYIDEEQGNYSVTYTLNDGTTLETLEITAGANSKQAGHVFRPSGVDAEGRLVVSIFEIEEGYDDINYHFNMTTGHIHRDADAEDINSFAEDHGFVAPFTGLAIVIEHTYHIWRYYPNEENGVVIGWRDDGLDTVSQFTNTNPGIILGAAVEGKVYAENDGTGSVYGWSDLTTNIDNLDANKVNKTDLATELLAINGLIDSEGNRIDQLELDLSSHESDKTNPHEVTASQVGLGNVVNTGDSATPIQSGTTKFTTGGAYTLKSDLETNIGNVNTSLTNHKNDKNNPHAVTAAQVGLDKVGNFKAVSTEANQGLSSTEKSNARTNIGAGTSSFSGSYNDLSNKPTIPQGTVTSVQVQATSPVTSSQSNAQSTTLNTTIALADNYGDTKNPYASKTKQYVLAAPKNENGVPSFRKLDASDVGITVTSSSVSDGTNTFNKYVPDTQTAQSGFKKLTTNTQGFVTGGENVTASDITGLSPYVAGTGLTSTTSNGQVTFKESYASLSGNTKIEVSDWTEITDGATEPTVLYYKAEKSVSGVTSDSTPVLDVIINPEDYADIDAINEAWSKIYSAQTVTGKINFYAIEKPEVALSVAIKGY